MGLYERDEIERLIEQLLDLELGLPEDWELKPPLRESEVAEFELEYSIGLPSQYRTFLTTVSGGGAGLFNLGEHDDGGWGTCSWADGNLVSNPSRPFAHLRRWSGPPEMLEQIPDFEALEDAGDAEALESACQAWEELAAAYLLVPEVMDGAIPIANLGCGSRAWLVVTGSQRGEVWQDDRFEDLGEIYPATDKDNARLAFRDWYLAHLQSYLDPDESEWDEEDDVDS